MRDMRHKRKNSDLRAVILETARHLFASRGYAQTSVHDIRKAAEVSIGAVYHHFDNKEAIARALLGDFAEKLTGALRDIVARHRSAHDRCLAAMAYLFAISESFPEAMDFYLFARHREFLTSDAPSLASSPLALLQKMVEDGIAKGEIRALPPRIATACLFGGALRMIRLLLEGEIEGPLMANLEEIWDCSWRAVAR